jgi:hypothetical protein
MLTGPSYGDLTIRFARSRLGQEPRGGALLSGVAQTNAGAGGIRRPAMPERRGRRKPKGKAAGAG